MINIEFKSVIELVKAFPDQQTCINHLEQLRWNGNVVSPFDETSKVYKCAGNKYKCKNTGKYFNVCTGTLFDNTKIDLQKWFMAIYLITAHKKGISSLQLSRDLDVTQKTAWFMNHRIRNCFGIENDPTEELEGIIEADETFVGGKNKNRHANKKVENSQGRSYKDKTPVLGLVSRGGELKAMVVPDTKAETIQPIVEQVVKYNSDIITDEWCGYEGLNTKYCHIIINHAGGQFANEWASTNRIEGFWASLKRGVIGIYHFMSKKHMQKYVDEFVFRYNTIPFSGSTRLNHLLKNSNRKLTYQTLIAK
jgi:hypothetical protein